jgi:hypothetical protein
MAHLTLISDTTPTSKTSRTDTRLIKMCKLYLLELQHLGNPDKGFLRL